MPYEATGGAVGMAGGVVIVNPDPTTGAGSGTLDLTDDTSTSSPVLVENCVTATVVVVATGWGAAAEVTLQWSLDGSNWFGWATPKTLAANGNWFQVDVRSLKFLRVAVTTEDAGAGTGTVEVFAVAV